MKTIDQIMTANPVNVRDSAPVSEVIALIQDNGFDHLPVITESGVLVGIISKTDVYKRLLDISYDTSGKVYTKKVLYNTKAREVMTKTPITVNIDDPVEEAIRLLLEGKFHAVPVINNGLLAGIVTSKDVLESFED